MSKSLYDEAIAEAKLLKETAEQNAKNAIIEAVTPRIRHFIEEQLIGSESSSANDDDSDVLDSVLSESVLPRSEREEVVLDESALESLLEMFGSSGVARSSQTYAEGGVDAVKEAIRDSVSSLGADHKEKLQQVANKLSERQVFLQGNDINNDMNKKQETSGMSTNDEILYEVDLSELAGLLKETSNLNIAERDDIELEERDDIELEELAKDEGTKPKGDDDDLAEALRSLGLDSLLNEEMLQVDLGDLELEDDAVDSLRDALSRATVTLVDDGEDADAEDVELGAEEEEDAEDAEAPVEDAPDDQVEMEPGLADLDEVFEIDESTLRSELQRLRQNLSEAKELTQVKGIKDAMEAHFGGSGSGKAGVKGAYGGTGGGKPGVKGAFGGGKESGDPLKVTLNKLSEAVKNERRRNRALHERLNEYRSAVETLREQLTDLLPELQAEVLPSQLSRNLIVGQHLQEFTSQNNTHVFIEKEKNTCLSHSH